MQPIVLISGGSRGDVQPFLMLGMALQASGYPVLLVLPPSYAGEVQANGLNFRPLQADFDVFLSSQVGKNLKTSGRNPFTVFRTGQTLMKDIARTIVEDIWQVTEGASAVIGHIGLSACTQAIKTVRELPLFHVALQPFMPTRDFAHPLIPVRLSLGKTYNRFSGEIVQRITWKVFSREINRFLEAYDIIHPMKWKDYLSQLNEVPILNAFSKTLIPFPSDWKSNNHITGFWFSSSLTDWQVPEELKEFLDAGSKPVFIGFGSVSDTTPLEMVLEALKITGERGVVTGLDFSNQKISNTVFASSSIPYEWLFDHVKAVIHHGGAGTTAQALRAQLPMLPVPHLLDQFFWAERAYQCGVALKPIPRKEMTADKVVEAINALVRSKSLKAYARKIGSNVETEDGLKHAVEVIQNKIKVQN